MKTALAFIFCLVVFILPQSANAQSCTSYENASCVTPCNSPNTVKLADDCTYPAVCCQTVTTVASCSSQGGTIIPTGTDLCASGTIVPASGIQDGFLCCVPPTCSSLGGSCVSSVGSCTASGGTIKVSSCAQNTPDTPNCCVAAEQSACTVVATMDGKNYTGTCTAVGSCASPKVSQVADSCSGQTTCCYDPSVVTSGCAASGGHCLDSCGDGQTSNSSLSCADTFKTCCIGDLAKEAYVPSGFVTCSGTDCTACNLVSMGNKIVLWLTGILFVIFAILAFAAGFTLITSKGDVSAIQDAKSKFVNAFIGIIIVLAAWLLVDTLLRSLVGSDQINGNSWGTIECGSQTTPTVVREAGDSSYTYDTETGNSSSAGGAAGTATNPSESGISGHNAAVAQLNSGGFTIQSSGGCTDASKSNCTSLDGVRPTTITRINELQSAVGETLIITGGTETGHANIEYSHSNGYKIDLHPSTALNNYITTNYTQISSSKYKDSNGNTYYRHEPDHWDITITN